MIAASSECAFIDLNAEDPALVAKVLKQAWMEGGIKRGLKGSVLVVDQGLVRIVAKGPKERLSSFADWLQKSSGLVSCVNIGEEDDCPAVELTNRFNLADAMDEKAQPWRDLLSEQAVITGAPGSKHSSDEGRF